LSAAEVELPEFVHSLSLPSRNLTMVLEEDLVHFSNLRFLDLSDNSVPLPSLASLPALRELCMHCNGVSAFVIDNFVRPQPQPRPPCFARLQKLDLSFNGVAVASIAELSKMPELRELNLTGNYLASIPADWSGFAQLTRLVLARNQLRDAALSLVALASCPRLHELDISQNMIERVPIALAALPANACFPCLVYLDLSRNYVYSEEAVLPLAHCPRLELLDLRKNLLVVGGASDAAPTGIHFVSKTMPAKSRVTAAAFPAIARELVQAKRMVVLIEDVPPPPSLPLPKMQAVDADEGAHEDGDDRRGDADSGATGTVGLGGAADDIMADPDFQSDVGVANVYAAMSTNGYYGQSRGSSTGSYATMGHTPIDAFPPIPMHGHPPTMAPWRADASARGGGKWACNKQRHNLGDSGTHG
jgi:hypothetical protein